MMIAFPLRSNVTPQFVSLDQTNQLHRPFLYFHSNLMKTQKILNLKRKAFFLGAKDFGFVTKKKHSLNWTLCQFNLL